jgi:hypothetical protein
MPDMAMDEGRTHVHYHVRSRASGSRARQKPKELKRGACSNVCKTDAPIQKCNKY